MPSVRSTRRSLATTPLALVERRRIATRADQAVAALRASLSLREDVITAIEANASLDPDARDAAMRLARECSESASALEAKAWYLVRLPGRDHDEHLMAARLARRACELSPETGGFWNTLGAAQCRIGDYDAAVESLTKAIDLRDKPQPHDFAFRAMALHHLGRYEAAEEDFLTACDLMAVSDNWQRADRIGPLYEAGERLDITCPELADVHSPKARP